MEQQTFDLKKMDLNQLKALAYDFISQKENIQTNLNVLNNEIGLRLRGGEEIPPQNGALKKVEEKEKVKK